MLGSQLCAASSRYMRAPARVHYSACIRERHVSSAYRAAVPRNRSCAVAHGSAEGSGVGFAPPKDTGSLKKTAQNDAVEIQDKLISVFQAKPQGDWRKLLAFSKQWPGLADGVFARVGQQIDAEADPDRKLKLRRFLRALRTASDEVARYREVFDAFEAADTSEYEAIVVGARDAMTPSFHEFLQHIIAAEHEAPERQEVLVELGSRILAIDEAYRKAQADEEAMTDAAEKFHKLLQVESMEEAEKQIDQMASSGELDPAFLLTMAKAYSGVKETDYTRDEVKDVMYHLYMKAKEATAREAPKEVRILKHLLSMEDPQQRSAELEAAMTQGPELTTDQEDFLATNPKRLLTTVEAVLAAYKGQKGQGTLLGQTADIMDPVVITRLQAISDEIHKRYM